MAGIHCIVVDDDDMMLRILEPALHELDTSPPIESVLTAQTPSAALDLVRAAPPGPLVVISDFNLKAPRNGLDVLRETATLRPDSVRILLSGYAAEQIGDVADGGRIDGFLEKPMRISELHAPLARLIRECLLANASA